MIVHIHYRGSDGEIFGFETGTSEPTPQPDMAIAIVDMDRFPDGALHKIDLATLDVVDKTHEERQLALAPKPEELTQAIASTLYATDGYMAPDRPLSDEARAGWAAYRQMLRDLSKLPTPAAMVAAWTPDPSGHDPIAHIRARISQGL